MMEKRGWRLALIIPGIALTAGIAMIMPDNSAGNDNPFVAAGAGAIAISAMILPGISGSFVLLVMGQYQNFIAKITLFLSELGKGHIDITALIWLTAFALGMGVGILAFSRLLAMLLKKARSATMAFLIGLLLGSLFVLWPFKDLSQGAQVKDRHGEIKQDVQLATADNRLPISATEGVGAALALLAGLGGSAGLISLGKKHEQSDD
jgi:putative membrane protein